MKAAIFAYSRRGCSTALRVRQALCTQEDECRCYAPKKYADGEFQAITTSCSVFTAPVFAWADVMVFVGAAGIAVRSIAPYVRDKRTDPAVLVVDELGKFVISLLSGHIGGANEQANSLADKLGAVSVVTTATDINKKFSADAWAARQGLAVTSMRMAKAVSAAILERPIFLVSDFPIVTGLPSGTEAGESGDVGICISYAQKKPFDETLLLVPPVLHVGIGCRRGTTAEQIGRAVELVLREHQFHPKAVKCVTSIDLKKDEEGLLEFCRRQGWPAVFYTAQELAAQKGEFTASSRVLQVTGVDNVCERSSMVGAEKLLVKKTALDGVTVAVAIEHWEVRFE